MKHLLLFLKIVLLVVAALQLNACGKVSDPKPYDNSAYPHTYPRI